MKNLLKKQTEESVEWRPAAEAASRVEDAAIEDLASLLLRAAEPTGRSPEELLAGISDSTLSDLYRSIVRRSLDRTALGSAYPVRPGAPAARRNQKPEGVQP
jgi:hypothetical protein